MTDTSLQKSQYAKRFVGVKGVRHLIKLEHYQDLSLLAIDREVAYLKRRGRMYNEHTEIHGLVEVAVDGL